MLKTRSMENKNSISKLFSFKGRIGRSEYCTVYLAIWLISFPLEVIKDETFIAIYSLIFLVLLIPMYWIFFAQGAKRCHDLGHSGWFQLIPFYFLWLLFAKGNLEANEYGDHSN